MAMNKYMHPRNKYRSPPNFKQLALEFPEFRKYAKQDITGKVTLDFKDIKSLRALSSTLLKKDFDLDVEIPLDKLIPTIPLRLNYILWLEDLLSLAKKKEQVKGIDIGTGASCVYPLLAAKQNKWAMTATEIDEDSISFARNNVERNSLQDLIKIVKAETDGLLKSVVGDEEYDFCMCNPPFFGSTQELHPSFNSRNLSRPKPKNSFCASVNEVVVKGGEVDYLKKLINESKELGKKVRIYTTMMGHKRTLPQLKELLREIKVTSFKDTEFCQGNTTRWGLAWTFFEEIDLKKCFDPVKLVEKKVKPTGPLIFEVQLKETNEVEFNTLNDIVLKLLEDLQMSVEEVTRKKSVRRYFVSAFSNTWSNQRRKRREQLRKVKDSLDSIEGNNNEKESSEECSRSPTKVEDLRKVKDSLDSIEGNNNENESSEECSRSPTKVEDCDSVINHRKRTFEDHIDGAFLKRLKISEGNAAVFLKFIVSVRLVESSVTLELDTLEDMGKRDYLHQILQYIKNNLRKKD